MLENRSGMIAAQSRAMREGTLTVADAVAAHMRCVRAHNPRYRAFSHLGIVEGEIVGLQSELDAGGPRGSLHGIVASVKGNIPIAGMPWTEGSAVFAGRAAKTDAAIVARLREAGAVIFGSTTLSELAMYGTTNAFEPMGLNPWDMTRTAGGSSTGAGVAAALGMALVNIGTDSGGSIRNPACHCGVVGLMPRRGALPHEGLADYAPSLSTIGLIAPTATDAATAFHALAAVPPAKAAPSLRLLVPKTLVESAGDDETLALFRGVLDRLVAAGFALVERDIAGWREGEAAAGIVSLYESGQALARMDLARATAGIQRRAEAAGQLSGAQVEAARRAMREFTAAFNAALAETEATAVATPTWPFAAPEINAVEVSVQNREVPVDPARNIFVRAGNAANAAAITLPIGLYPTAAVPAGLQLMTGGGDEANLLALAEQVERVVPRMPRLDIT